MGQVGSGAGVQQDSVGVSDHVETQVTVPGENPVVNLPGIGEIWNEGTQEEVKGPDPAVWGTQEERDVVLAESGMSQEPQNPGVGEIWNEGTEEEVKGPDPSQWQVNAQGENESV